MPKSSMATRTPRPCSRVSTSRAPRRIGHQGALRDLQRQVLRAAPHGAPGAGPPPREPRILQAARGEVDGHGDGVAGAPATSAPARAPSPAPSRVSGMIMPALLGQRDELVGRDEPMDRVRPAQQRLHAADLPAGERHFGLVVEAAAHRRAMARRRSLLSASRRTVCWSCAGRRRRRPPWRAWPRTWPRRRGAGASARRSPCSG